MSRPTVRRPRIEAIFELVAARREERRKARATVRERHPGTAEPSRFVCDAPPRPSLGEAVERAIPASPRPVCSICGRTNEAGHECPSCEYCGRVFTPLPNGKLRSRWNHACYWPAMQCGACKAWMPGVELPAHRCLKGVPRP